MAGMETVPSQRVRAGDVLGLPVNLLTWTDALDCIFEWARGRRSSSVCLCNVHSIVTALQLPDHAQALRAADLVVADGAPVAWLLRRTGQHDQTRICGPDLMWACCREAARFRAPIFLYGATYPTLQQLELRLHAAFPEINIVGAIAPPFWKLAAAEDLATVEAINGSGAAIVWVGLGCPKQEAWMHAHRGRVQAVMIGVGAAFDFHAGVVRRAPRWMQRSGLEWLHRILQDPHRLAGRYLVSNTLFIIAVLRHALRRRAGVDNG
ncbi:MAG: WecB/TagA/CpsF family glycosyltransferase [Bradyrhizobium sp.]